MSLHLVLNTKDLLVFSVRYKSHDVAILVFEDKHRPGELMRDFSFLYPKYYSSEDEWDDSKNLIKVTIYVYKKEILAQEDICDKLLAIAEDMIEEKPNVNPCIQFEYNDILIKKFQNRGNNSTDYLNFLLSIHNSSKDMVVSKDNLEHLSQ